MVHAGKAEQKNTQLMYMPVTTSMALNPVRVAKPVIQMEIVLTQLTGSCTIGPTMPIRFLQESMLGRMIEGHVVATIVVALFLMTMIVTEQLPTKLLTLERHLFQVLELLASVVPLEVPMTILGESKPFGGTVGQQVGFFRNVLPKT